MNALFSNTSAARKFLFSIALSFSVFCSLQAQNAGQDYKSAFGVRFGNYSNLGLTFKTFVNDKAALELMAFFRSNTGYKNIDFGALYEIQNRLTGITGLSWYIGGGGFVGFYSVDANYTGSQGTSFQIAGVIGLEYKIPGAPLTVSIDYIPRYAFSGNTGFIGTDGNLAVRYTF